MRRNKTIMNKKLTKEQLEKISGGKIQIVRDQLCIIDENPKEGEPRIFWHEPVVEIMQTFLNYQERQKRKGVNNPRPFEDWFKRDWLDLDEALNNQ